MEGVKPVNDLMKEVLERSTLCFEEENRDLKAIRKVEKMLEESKDFDVILKVQNKEFPAHKNILSFRSSYFSKMFSSKREFSWEFEKFIGGMQESHCKTILLDDISPQAFEGNDQRIFLRLPI